MPVNQLKAYLHYGPPNDDKVMTGSFPVFVPMNTVTTVTISMSIRYGLDDTVVSVSLCRPNFILQKHSITRSHNEERMELFYDLFIAQRAHFRWLRES
jgi:hypothetical protein